MGLALVFLLISLLIGALAFGYSVSNPRSENIARNVIVTTCICICVFGTVATAIIVGDSYSGYLNNRAFYDATVEQYRGAVEMYKDYAVIDMSKTRFAFTDFKYQGYQKEISSMILELRRKIVKYNRSFILKKIKNASWFFNWYIVANDPDMKIIRMIEKKKMVEKKKPVTKSSGFNLPEIWYSMEQMM
jgi:hypothetical protein